MAGQSFQLDVTCDKYCMLPEWWHGTTPEDKCKIVVTVQKYNGYTIECVKELCEVCHVTANELQNARLCVECAEEDPKKLSHGVPTLLDHNDVLPVAVHPEIAAAKAVTSKITSNLEHFMLKPPGKTGVDLFSHLIKLREISTGKPNLTPAPYLDAAVSESNVEVLMATSMFLVGNLETKSILVKSAGGTGATMRLAKRKLDSYGMVKAYSCLANDEKQLAKMKNQNQLAASTAHIAALEKAEASKKKQKKIDDLVVMATAAKNKLVAKKNDVSKLTQQEICSLLFSCYNETIEDASILKAVLVGKLQAKIEANPGAILPNIVV